MGLTECRSGEQMEHRATFPTSVVQDRRTMPVMRRWIRRQRVSVRTVQTVRMKRLKQELIASLFVQQVVNWKTQHGIALCRPDRMPSG